MNKPKTEVIKIRITSDQKKELEKIALAESRTFAGQVRLVIREWLINNNVHCVQK